MPARFFRHVRAALGGASILLAAVACGDSDPSAPVVNPLDVGNDTVHFGIAAPQNTNVRTLVVTNDGASSVNVKVALVGGDAVAVDSATDASCFEEPLAAGAQCEIDLHLVAEAAGDYALDLHVGTGRAGEAPRVVRLLATRGVLLRVTFAGSGEGSVAVSGAAQPCTSTCEFALAQGERTVTPTASPDSYFAGWSGSCTGTGACTVTPGASTDVTATFTRLPETTIAGGPPAMTNGTSATWIFTTERGATFQCSLNDGAWAECASPHTVNGLAVGALHRLMVRAVDAAGQADPSPAVSNVTVTHTRALLRYEFDGDAQNSGVLNGFDGTAASVTWPAGRFGNAVKFDGTAATSVLLPGTGAMLSRGGAMTISLWYREDVARANAHLFTMRSGGLVDRGWETYHGAASSTLLTSCSQGGCFSFGAGTLGAWHNLTYRYAAPGAPVEFWVDGVLAGTIANAGGGMLTGAPLGDITLGNTRFGALGNTGAALPGVYYVDRLQVWDTAFPHAEQCTRVIGGTWSGTACTLP